MKFLCVMFDCWFVCSVVADIVLFSLLQQKLTNVTERDRPQEAPRRHCSFARKNTNIWLFAKLWKGIDERTERNNLVLKNT